ncbi:DUF6333 family protein [Streptomyces sp. JV185]|uniref:DUF6333 family protein n=1 Tax=Streptomyces sp. JV185 TaxID=858638 RepID=UPI002E76297B|nr:DUF6333 family protein [Streptomyces sp. JV185]MEE1771459.1 DUF6333 family protein [Streptomyces sp. JV185]
MTDNTFWTSPADRMVRGSGARYDITVLRPPFTVTARSLPPNDPAGARRFAESFPTVDAVLEDLGLRPASESPELATRADLDVVRAGVWGNVLGISDPALVDNGNGTPLLHEAKKLRERFPDARIVGRVEVDCGEDHTEDIVWLPDGTMFHASGWPTGEPWELSGDPHAVAAALGVTAQELEDIDVDLDAEPGEVEWADFVSLALGEADPWPWPHLKTSAFGVRHTRSRTRTMEELYFLGG